jgi:hypothetical protein
MRSRMNIPRSAMYYFRPQRFEPWMVELPYLSTETADRLKAVVEWQRIGNYPQITQIPQIQVVAREKHA